MGSARPEAGSRAPDYGLRSTVPMQGASPEADPLHSGPKTEGRSPRPSALEVEPHRHLHLTWRQRARDLARGRVDRPGAARTLHEHVGVRQVEVRVVEDVEPLE